MEPNLDDFFSNALIEKISEEKNDCLIQFKGDDLAIYGPLPKSLLLKFEHKLNPEEPFTRFFPRDYYLILDELESRRVNLLNKIRPNVDIKNKFKNKILDSSLINNVTDNDTESEQDIKFDPQYKLYTFQNEAINLWFKSNGRGTILIPTGGGKTIIAIEIIQKLKLTTLIVVPTLVLIKQWEEQLIKFLQIPKEIIGCWGGGKKELKQITIITYDSAHIYSRKLRDQFGVLILDEAHHLTGVNYSIIADGYLAQYRLALSATISKNDNSYDILMNKGFGPIVYETSATNLVKQNVITGFEVETIKVELDNPQEYKDHIRILQQYIRSKRLRGNVFQQIVFRVNQDPQADKALKSYRIAKQIAFAANKKLNIIADIIRRHEDDKILIFSDIVAYCEEIQRKFMIPCVTYRTPADERNEILDLFRSVENAKLVSSTIFDEGIDIPDANIGIIAAGSGKKRQFVQRLGRIIRKHPNKSNAKLYEIVSKETMEERASLSRKKDL